MIRNKLQYTESSDDFDFAISMIPCRIIIFFNRGSSHFDVGVIRELKEKCFISQRTFSKDVSEEKLVSMGKGYKVTINRDVPVFVNLTDSLLSGLIKERMNVCLPLDLLNVNSAFGMRDVIRLAFVANFMTVLTFNADISGFIPCYREL